MPRKPSRLITDESPLVPFDPRSERQRQAVKVFEKNDLTFLIGPAGTGKTHVAVYLAVNALLSGKVRPRYGMPGVMITRPIVEAGEKLGFLPGEMDEKVHPYMIPIYDCVSKLVNKSDQFIAKNFEIAPLAYMRGRTFENCVSVLDEAQNCTVAQLKLLMSRLGNGGKMIISGDTDQSDIGRKSGLRPWVESLRGEEGIGFVEFTDADICRHPLVRKILANCPK